ncbi:E3 binding domain-containing protein [Mesorhizobium caraganae]|uniref:E3 binding domain-containing protein n=1 Tax=Mesorhizobium caraganae TaxID=483206 RepID=UPI00177B7B42|nr:E3 binding domain-containing protein [Mesorhizobium caraganae]MBM2712678.1 E3 binding domain-containing protein [Mesorhizobium caraganae]
MNMAVAQSQRLAVSPYARRLARERALPLETLRGSGPGGRILAADVLGFVPAAAPVNLPDIVAPSVAAPRIAAFTASVALTALRDLLAALESTGRAFDLDDVLLRAAGRAFGEIPDVAKVGDTSVALELAGRQAVFATIPEMSLTLLHATRLAALADNRDYAEMPALLSILVLPASDIRPVMLPLLPGRGMRLAVSVSTAGDHAECLLTADTASVDEAVAAAWFAALKSAIEHPLRLFV